MAKQKFLEHYYDVDVHTDLNLHGVTSSDLTKSNDKEVPGEVVYDKSSLQFEVPMVEAKMILDYANQLSPSIIYKDKDDPTVKGIEDECHCTVLYGILTNNFSDVRNVLQGNSLIPNTRPFKVTLGPISFFEAKEGDKYDVMKIDVISEDLIDLNKRLRDNLEYKSEHPNYIPHITIAYVKAGTSKKYKGDLNVFEGRDFMIDSLVFHTADNKKINMPLMW